MSEEPNPGLGRVQGAGGGGRATFWLSRDGGCFAEDPRTGRRDSPRVPLPPPSPEALIKHKSGSPAAACQRRAGGHTARGGRYARCARCWTLGPWPFPGGPSHRHSRQLELGFNETAVHSPASPQALPLAARSPTPVPVAPPHPRGEGR